MLLLVPVTGCQTVSESPFRASSEAWAAPPRAGSSPQPPGQVARGSRRGSSAGPSSATCWTSATGSCRPKPPPRRLRTRRRGSPWPGRTRTTATRERSRRPAPTRRLREPIAASTSRRSPSTARRRTRTEPPAVSRTAAERSSADHAKHRGRSHEYSPTRIVYCAHGVDRDRRGLHGGGAGPAGAQLPSPQELRQQFQETDRTGDVKIDREEFHRRSVELFYFLDKDRKGYLVLVDIKGLTPGPVS
jgi:hypothetical protein